MNVVFLMEITLLVEMNVEFLMEMDLKKVMIVMVTLFHVNLFVALDMS